MKKFICLFLLTSILSNSLKSQVMLNELQNLVNGGRAQFVELYNAGSSNENLDCYTLVTMNSYTNSNSYSFYVFNFNNTTTINPFGFLVVNGSNVNEYATVSQHTYANGTYSTAVVTSGNVQPFLAGNSNSINLISLLFRNGQLVDGFGGKRTLSEAQAFLGTLANFTAGSPCVGSTLTLNFQSLRNQVISTTADQAGSKSFSRVCEGLCYPWTTLVPSAGIRNSDAATCTTSSTNPPSWTFSSLSYRDANNNSVETSASNNTITQGALAFNSGGQTATLSLTASSFSNAEQYPVNVNVWYDRDGNYNQTQGVSSGDELYSSLLIPSGSLASLTNFQLEVPVYADGAVIVQISTLPGACTFSTTKNVFTSLGLLPAKLSTLSAKASNNGITLNWSTFSEQNNKGFEIQRSMGNTNEFKTIGFVGTKAKQGNSESEISYSFEDADVKPGQIHYYRLNQIDFNGKSAFSPVKSIKPGSIESNLSVYPNPNQGSFTVNTGSASGKLNIFVMDNTGRVVHQYMNVSTTNTRINNLKKGFYTLKIVNTESGEQSAQRVVVQ